MSVKDTEKDVLQQFLGIKTLHCEGIVYSALVTLQLLVGSSAMQQFNTI